MSHSASLSPSVPLVIQLGFAGARKLFDVAAHPQIEAEAFESAAVDQLVGILKNLPRRLGLPEDSRHFFCGISQIAIGGDTVFTRACQKLEIHQRLFLPQPIDSYLNAEGSSGPDFNELQKEKAKIMLASQHLIQTRVVSDSADRHERFRDVNLEIARVSDVVICLVREGQIAKIGGTHELIDFAAKRGRHCILLQLSVGPAGEPVFSELPIRPEENVARPFVIPSLPNELGAIEFPTAREAGLPSGQKYCEVLKNLSSNEANRLRFVFKWAALIIVIGHVLATILAVSALKLQGGLVIAFLIVEFLLLASGLVIHYRLHHAKSLSRWAAFRLVAEVARSLKAMREIPVYLDHLFSLPFPPTFRAMVRTINVLHLRDTAGSSKEWTCIRDRYVKERLTADNKGAQIFYNQLTKKAAGRYLILAQRVFYIASITALVATFAKFLISCDCLHTTYEIKASLKTLLGCIAIIFPVLAVAALSLASAFDLDAKKHTSEELVKFLIIQSDLLQSASSQREFAKLLIETESRLLGETVNWYARRTFVGVA